ncbi:MAG: hypothetical protein ACRELY_26755, partial [Polyangiaceae bacterium]
MFRTSSIKLSLVSLAALALLAGCSGGADESVDDSSASATSTISPVDAAKILDLVDYPDTDEALLDITIKLDSRAAKGIIAKRNGADGVYPSSDDAPFTTLAQLDAVSYVGDSALAKLQSYAIAHPAPASESVEGVSFSGWQSVAVVYGVNHASAADLDAFLDSRAAKALAAGAPYKSVAQMGPISYVGSSALTALKAHAQGWWTDSQTPQQDCIASFSAAITPELDGLLFLSESDRPFDVVSFPGAGTSAPTGDLVMSLTKAEAGSTFLIRPVDDYYGDLEAGSD